jgi:bifunctional non-homologous end joining protein LigD
LGSELNLVDSNLSLAKYNKKRDFTKTLEPKGKIKRSSQNNELRSFVVQKHDASKLHYDFRLESEDGVLVSWAVPKGPSMDPETKRLAILVEDHPLDYLHFEGSIPSGNYGAGTVIVWDTGSYSSKDTLSEQLNKGKISIELYGNKLKGLFSLIRTKRENQWLMIKVKDEYASKDDLTLMQPDSVLTGKSNSDIEVERKSTKKVQSTSLRAAELPSANSTKDSNIDSLFLNIRPMLASPFDKAFNSKDWVFEIKWDGVRAILFKDKKYVKIQSRNGNDITNRYPEIVNAAKIALDDCRSGVIDGEIVILNENGVPDFHIHQHRINIQNSKEIMVLSVQTPATFYLFDILYKDGKSIKDLGYLERRMILSSLLRLNDTVKISDYIEEKGIEILKSSKELKLEGIVAKHKNSIYREGIRSKDWLKIKNTKTQDCVIIGYTKGEGVRLNYFGSLVLAVYCRREIKLKFVGHVGTGFDDDTLNLVFTKLKSNEIDFMPVDKVPYMNRETTWLNPVLVTEVKFTDWTKDGILRAPVFLRLREDKKPEECVIEADNPKESSPPHGREDNDNKTGSAIKVNVTNPSKVFWKATRDHPKFLKKDLIHYYEIISDWILPHLKDRPLSLSRYPNGIDGKSFYQKNWDQKKPDFVVTAKVLSEHRGDSINYIVCNNRETLLWIANLGCIEIHPWYSRINDFDSCNSSSLLYEEKCGLNFPDFIVFDLDPYIYSGKEKKGEEPEYNITGFKATVEVAYQLKDILRELKINSYVKTSGKSGLHIYVPIVNEYPYEQTKNFAEIMAKIMVSKFPDKVTMEWNTSKRKGKVFFDYNQNSRGKTIASVYSLRPNAAATVSMPVEWNNLGSVLPTDFTITSVPQLISKKNDIWAGVLSEKQNISKIISKVE